MQLVLDHQLRWRIVGAEVEQRTAFVPPGHRRELVGCRDDQRGPIVVDVLVDEQDREPLSEGAVWAATPDREPGREVAHPVVGAVEEPSAPWTALKLFRIALERSGAGLESLDRVRGFLPPVGRSSLSDPQPDGDLLIAKVVAVATHLLAT